MTNRESHVKLSKHSRERTEHRGVEQLEARRAHNPEVVGSSPASATIKKHRISKEIRCFLFLGKIEISKTGGAFVLDLFVTLVYIGIRINENIQLSAAYHHNKKCRRMKNLSDANKSERSDCNA